MKWGKGSQQGTLCTVVPVPNSTQYNGKLTSTTTYSKAIMISFFIRLTKDLPLRRYVWFVSGVAATTLLASVLTHALHCLPIQNNWQVVPYPGAECTYGIISNIVIAAGNVLTDLLLLAVPPILLKDARMPLWQ